MKLIEFWKRDWEIIGIRITGNRLTMSFREIPKRGGLIG